MEKLLLITILTRPLVGITFSLDQKNIVETLTSFNYSENIDNPDAS
jgi:hypothetical protein